MLQLILKSRIRFPRLSVQPIRVSFKNAHASKTRIQRLYDDGIDLKQQSVEINALERIRRCTFYKDVDIWTFYKTLCPNVRTLGDVLEEGCVASKDGPCLGHLQSSGSVKSVEWLSYSMVIERSCYIGSHLWSTVKLTPMQSKVAIISSNRAEYLLVEHGCYMYGFIVVGLYTSYDTATILNVLQRTQTEVLVVDSLERIQSFEKELLNNDQIKEILIMDEISCDNNSKIRSIPSILKTMKANDLCPRPTIDPHSIATFIMTSGTTGKTKKDG
ncbi:unnamed protein product [Rotaria sp. Silwood1]|nr:unnamed protein product [Rotaria sp. Silwood1]